MTGWIMQEHGVPESRIKVIKQAEDHVTSSGKHVIQWVCECNCEKHTRFITSGISLRTGKTKSCGCLHKEIVAQRSLIDLTGQKFNRLTVIERDFSRTDKTFWKCKCDCGSDIIVTVSGGDLKNGHVKSCGCLKKESAYRKREHNLYSIDTENNIAKFYLKQGGYFIVNLEDFDMVNSQYWYLDSKGYVTGKEYGTQNTIRLHNILCPNFTEVDHENQNKLDNRRCNLREATRQENVINRPVSKANSSGFIGVYWSKKDQSWYSQITINRKNIHLGYTKTKEQAVVQRLQAELKYFGPEFAPQRHLFEKYGIVSINKEDYYEL